MTVTMPHQTLISDRDIVTLRQLVEAAELTLANDEPRDTMRNLSALSRLLSALASGEVMRPETLCYGTVSLRDICLLGGGAA